MTEYIGIVMAERDLHLSQAHQLAPQHRYHCVHYATANQMISISHFESQFPQNANLAMLHTNEQIDTFSTVGHPKNKCDGDIAYFGKDQASGLFLCGSVWWIRRYQFWGGI